MSRPLRAAAVVFALGFLCFWLIRPIGNPCPDRGALPLGSSKASSPSFAPPGARTCMYTTPGGTKATFTYVPWLDWFVLALVAGLVAMGVRRVGEGWGGGGGERGPRAPREPRAGRPPKAPREPRAGRPPKAPREPSPPRERPSRSAKGGGERDAAERERARLERAERARRQRGE